MAGKRLAIFKTRTSAIPVHGFVLLLLVERMDWFKVTRSSGEKRGVGEFVVEDRNGNEWQVRGIESKRTPGTVACARPVVCMNAGYEAGIELEGDLFDAVKEFIAAE